MIKMSKKRFELTAEEIRCLQELSEGWEMVWERISKELLFSVGTDGKEEEEYADSTKGRLYSVARSCQYYDAGAPISGFDIDDFVSFVYERYHKEVLNQTRFINYDYDKYGGNVLAYLCYPPLIRQMFWHYQKKNTLIKTLSAKRSEKESAPHIIRYDNQVTGKDGEEKFSIESIIDDKSPSEPYYDESNPLQVLSMEKWVLTISPTAKGTFYSRDIHAGLQLYPRIDYADKNMRKLQENVHQSVANADKFNNKPQAKIEKEHQAATERIDETINAICNKLFDIKRQKVRNINVDVEKKITRQIAKYRLQEIYRPLNAIQIVDLLGINRTTADQMIKRYYEIVTDMLPLPEDAKEQFRPLFLQTFQNVKGENDD
jgi:hypothetical protein